MPCKMPSFSIDHILISRDGAYLELVAGSHGDVLPALAEALVEHARCVSCGTPPSLPIAPCPCGRKPADGVHASFHFRVTPNVWRDILDPLCRKDRRRQTSRDSRRRRNEAIRNSWEPSYTEKDIACLRRLQNDRCYYCGGSIRTTAQVEHLDPLAYGGSTGFSNIMLACPSCNTAKGTLSERQYWKRLERSLAPARFSRLRNAAKLRKRAKRHCYRRTGTCAYGCTVDVPGTHGRIDDLSQAGPSTDAG